MAKGQLEAFRSKRELVRRLVLAELLARRGEGPLALRMRVHVRQGAPDTELPQKEPEQP